MLSALNFLEALFNVRSKPIVSEFGKILSCLLQ